MKTPSREISPRVIPGYPLLVGPCPSRDRVRGVSAEPVGRVRAVINVSDHPGITFDDAIAPNARKHWFPIFEVGVWPQATIHAVLKALHHHVVERKELTYLHCAGGVARSPSLATLWLIGEGHSRAEAMRLVDTDAFENEGRHGCFAANIEEFARLTLATTTAAADVIRRTDRAGLVELMRGRRQNARLQAALWPVPPKAAGISEVP